MPRKRNLLNVRSMLERIVELQKGYVQNTEKYPGQRMAPIFEEELRHLAFLASCKLKKHNSRKDIYIETAS